MKKLTALCIVLLGASIACLVMSWFADAASWCLNQTSRTTLSSTTVNGVSYVLGPDTENCPYGCAGGRCVPSESNDSPLAMAILFGITAIALMYLGLNLKEDYAVMSWLFIPLSIVMLASGLFYVSNMGVFQDNMMQSLAWIFYAIIIVAVLLVFIFIIGLLTGAFKHVFPYSKGHYDDKSKR